MAGALTRLDPELDAVPGTVSVWCAPCPEGPPRYARLPDTPHYAASTMKLALLVAAHRAHEAGTLDLDAPVAVGDRFPSALPGAPDFRLPPSHDPDPEVGARIGGTASLRWLMQHMIIESSNLAANIVLRHLDSAGVAQVWRLAGGRGSTTRRGIEDLAARDAGIDNTVTAADLGRLLAAIVAGARAAAGPPASRLAEPDPAGATAPATTGVTVPVPAGTAAGCRLAGRDACRQMLDTLLAQRRREDLAAGLPPGTRLAHKNGWVTGVRHAAGVVFPRDAPPYTIVVCATTPLARHGRGDPACALVARVAAASWADRHGTARG